MLSSVVTRWLAQLSFIHGWMAVLNEGTHERARDAMIDVQLYCYMILMTRGILGRAAEGTAGPCVAWGACTGALGGR